MIPLLPFFAGIVVGAAALSALRSERTRQTLNETGARLRGAARSAEESVRAATCSGLSLLRGATTEDPAGKPTEEAPAKTKAATKRTAKKAAAARPAKPAAAKRAPRKPKTPKAPEAAA